MSRPIRVRFEGRCTDPLQWRAVDSETGRPIDGVLAVTIVADVRTGKPAIATIELAKFDLSAEVEATARRFGLEPAPRPSRQTTGTDP